MWDWEFAVSILPQILQSLKYTFLALILGFAVALCGGALLAVGVGSSNKWVRTITYGFVEFIRSTPLLVQLYAIFFVLPQFGITLSALMSGVLGLGIHYSTYLSEVFRAGIEAVPKGQWEAAKALGMSKAQIWTRVVALQALPPVVPVLGNYFVTMLKETPLLSAITVVEIMQTAKIIGGRSFRYLEGFTIVGIVFLLISYPASMGVRYLDKRIREKYLAK